VKSLVTVCELVVAFVHPRRTLAQGGVVSTALIKPRQATAKE
jgi:hypothetical protein